MWMKVDDRLHSHRKTRRVVRSGDEKRRDIAPMGLWVVAGSWAGQNGTDGWVPDHELDRWDDDWEELAHRLVKAGYWWPEERDGEPGHGFVDWEDYNPANGSSEAGAFGNHKRWHVDKRVVKPGCPHCPSVPNDIDLPDPISGGDVGGDSGGDVAPESQNVALPDPTRPDPTPSRASDDALDGGVRTIDRFEEWWDVYGKKDGKKAAEQKWRIALKKKGVTADLLIERTKVYIASQRAKGKHPEYTKNPTTWLNGEHWNDEVESPEPDPLANTPSVEELQRRRGF